MAAKMLLVSVWSAVKHRRWGLVLFGVGMLLAAAAIRRYLSVPRLNVILVTFDTTRADRLGAYGYKHGLTDAFDEFARQGVLFERAYAPAPITLPSHATMLTGLYPPEHGLRANGAGRLPPDIPFLPEILKQHGYDTGAFVAAPVLDSKYGLDRGFDAYDDDIRRSPGRFGEPRRDGKEVAESALQWLRQRTNRPFFCWLHLYDAHAPYDPRVNAYQQRFEYNPYDAGVAWEVKQFERVTAFLKERGLDSNTLVVVAGDHGEGLDDHLEAEHGMLVYETTLRVPFAFAGPPCRSQTRVAQAVSLVDLFPTLLDLLRIPFPSHLSGRSLAAALKGQTLEPRDCYGEAETPFVMNRWAPLRTVISGRWKYIHTTRPELYDLEHDPGELTNLAESATEEPERLQNRLEILQETFTTATAQNVTLSEKDIANLQALGYISGGRRDIGIDPDDAETLPDVKDFLQHLANYEKAKQLARKSQGEGTLAELNEAIALLHQIVQATSDFPMAELLLGDCLAQAGQLDDAERTYRALLARRPDFLKARLNLGRIFSTQGRFEQAAAELREFLQEDPHSATTYFELAQALTQLQDFDDAIEAYREAIRLAPEFTAASLQLGRLLIQLQRPKDAQKCFEDALAYEPRSVDLRAHLMMVLAQTGQNEQAIEQGRQLVDLDPQSFDTRFNLGILLIAQRRYADGIAQLRAAQKLRPEDPRPREQIRRAETAVNKLNKGHR